MLASPGRAARPHPEACLALVERALPLGHGPLPLLDRRSLQLDRAELAPAARELGLLGPQPLLPGRQLADELGDLGLARVEVARPEPEEPLERGPRVPQQALAPLEVRDRVLERGRLRLELAPACCEGLLELVLRRWTVAAPQDPRIALERSARGNRLRLAAVGRRADPKPSISERPAGSCEFARLAISPAANECQARGCPSR